MGPQEGPDRPRMGFEKAGLGKEEVLRPRGAELLCLIPEAPHPARLRLPGQRRLQERGVDAARHEGLPGGRAVHSRHLDVLADSQSPPLEGSLGEEVDIPAERRDRHGPSAEVLPGPDWWTTEPR